MEYNIDLHEMDAMARRIRSAAERLNRLGAKFPSLVDNSHNMLAVAKVMEMNISDLLHENAEAV
ncbi:hypothetical protein DESC_370089 [Desulfosarcina cetonica]|uniref:hypothetical protein n=1 Tax=Desulfosarcina cetonica TaxID=90730 RepID=UPI0006CF5BD5|nr:hypothetical protein [Desulfosarcina cetonica]VTR65720.1 hypothetical protein DESC_370089 [Desulfosarcina cetonica]